MGIIRVGAAGKRGAEPCVGTGGEGSRAATLLSLPAGTRLVLALSHAWRPSLGCWRCSWPSSARRGYRDVETFPGCWRCLWPSSARRVTGMWTAVGHIWLWMCWWFVLPAGCSGGCSGPAEPPHPCAWWSSLIPGVAASPSVAASCPDLGDIIYWWPWHRCISGCTLRYLFQHKQLCSLGISMQVMVEVKFQSRCW